MLVASVSATDIAAEEASLLAAMMMIAPAGIHVGCRRIKAGDEAWLLPEERRLITSQVPAARDASGAARNVARQLLAAFDYREVSIGRTKRGAPVWPQGIVGSLAHDEQWSVAAVAHGRRVRAVGIDVEPAEPLPDDLHDFVVGPADVFHADDVRLCGRLIFAAKEATYKAVHPLDGQILEYADITVDLINGHAKTITGQSVKLSFCRTPRIVMLAVI